MFFVCLVRMRICSYIQMTISQLNSLNRIVQSKWMTVSSFVPQTFTLLLSSFSLLACVYLCLCVCVCVVSIISIGWNVEKVYSSAFFPSSSPVNRWEKHKKVSSMKWDSLWTKIFFWKFRIFILFSFLFFYLLCFSLIRLLGEQWKEKTRKKTYANAV